MGTLYVEARYRSGRPPGLLEPLCICSYPSFLWDSSIFLVMGLLFSCLGIINLALDILKLSCGRQVKDHRFLRCWLPYVLYGCADLQGKIQLCAGKALGRIFKIDLAGELLSSLLDPLRSFYSDIDDGFSVLAENHISLKGGG